MPNEIWKIESKIKRIHENEFTQIVKCTVY